MCAYGYNMHKVANTFIGTIIWDEGQNIERVGVYGKKTPGVVISPPVDHPYLLWCWYWNRYCSSSHSGAKW